MARPLEVLYAGAAPELMNGVDQFNVQLPPGLNTFPKGSCSAGAAALDLVLKTLVGFVVNVTSNKVIVYSH
jgi:hypothetical protein